MIVCQHCTRPAQAYLCGTCIDELRDMLTGLPRWLDYLTDAALGQAKLSSSDGPRTKSDEQPIRVNLTASQQLSAVHATLVAIVRTIEDSHTLQMTPVRSHPAGFIGPLQPRWRRLPAGYVITSTDLAQWLAEHVRVIATHEAAAEHYDDVTRIIGDIERRINRPEPPRFCGPCPTYVEHNRHCGHMLYARHDAIEVTCRACSTTHNVERISQNLANRAEHHRFTAAEILMIMRAIGTPIPERTWRRWRKEERVRVRGYKRPDNPDGTRGAIGLTRRTDADEPAYRLGEVRKVYATSIRHSDALTCEITRV